MRVAELAPEHLYEDLRLAVLQGATGGAYGLAVFLRQGMAAWLGALDAYLPIEVPVNLNPTSQPMSEDLAGPMVRLLVEMVLSLRREVLV